MRSAGSTVGAFASFILPLIGRNSNEWQRSSRLGMVMAQSYRYRPCTGRQRRTIWGGQHLKRTLEKDGTCTDVRWTVVVCRLMRRVNWFR